MMGEAIAAKRWFQRCFMKTGRGGESQEISAGESIQVPTDVRYCVQRGVVRW